MFHINISDGYPSERVTGLQPREGEVSLCQDDSWSSSESTKVLTNLYTFCYSLLANGADALPGNKLTFPPPTTNKCKSVVTF